MIDELKHWSWATKDKIDTYCQMLNATMNIMPILGAPDVMQQKHNSATQAELHSLVNSANQMFKTAALASVPEALIDSSLREVVRALRNLLEHWDENQHYFSDLNKPISNPKKNWSASWFRDHFPGSTPWAGGWTNLQGYTIGGALYIGQLYDQVMRLLQFVEKAEKIDA